MPASASCASRCPAGAAEAGSADGKDEWACDCRDDCLLKNSCCVDYATYCLAGESPVWLLFTFALNRAIEWARADRVSGLLALFSGVLLFPFD